ncbi:hypothetical protein CAJAP_10686 [Camponotus japonicus]
MNVNVRVQRRFRGCPIKVTHQKTFASLVQPSSTRTTIDIEQSRLCSRQRQKERKISKDSIKEYPLRK